MKEINIIDCTLRDGGYYNNWDFSNEIVNDYLESMSRVGVKNIELGFRSLQKRDISEKRCRIELYQKKNQNVFALVIFQQIFMSILFHM